MKNQLRFAEDPRELEYALIARCAQTGCGLTIAADTALIAGIYRLCYLLLAPEHPTAAKHLLEASQDYFLTHPDQVFDIQPVLDSPAIIGLSRFHEKLAEALNVKALAKVPTPTNSDFSESLKSLLLRFEQTVKPQKPIKAYISNDAATHFYTGNRLTAKVAIEFNHRIISLDTVYIVAELQGSREQLLYIDGGYNSNFKLMHDDYRKDATKLDFGLSMVDVYILAPIDIALSKILSSNQKDKNDVAELIRLRLITRSDIELRGRAAISALVSQGNILERFEQVLTEL